jgi:hypothetical protein
MFQMVLLILFIQVQCHIDEWMSLDDMTHHTHSGIDPAHPTHLAHPQIVPCAQVDFPDVTLHAHTLVPFHTGHPHVL